MLWWYLKIWDLEWIFGCAVKASIDHVISHSKKHSQKNYALMAHFKALTNFKIWNKVIRKSHFFL